MTNAASTRFAISSDSDAAFSNALTAGVWESVSIESDADSSGDLLADSGISRRSPGVCPWTSARDAHRA